MSSTKLSPTTIAKDIENYVFSSNTQPGLRAKAILKQIGKEEDSKERDRRRKIVSTNFFSESDPSANVVLDLVKKISSNLSYDEAISFLIDLEKIKESTNDCLQKTLSTKKNQLLKEIEMIDKRLIKK